jgi:hypothetical protein
MGPSVLGKRKKLAGRKGGVGGIKKNSFQENS